MPAFGGAYTNVEENFEVPVLPLLREIAKAGAARGGEIKSFLHGTSEMLSSPTLEFVQYAIGENSSR